jgi:DNA-directed RNA polymerase specialized sigma24 family protein
VLAGGPYESWTEDVVQEGLIDVLRSHGRCRATTELEVIGWIGAIARRQLIALFRQETRQSHLALAAASQNFDEDAACSPSLNQALSDFERLQLTAAQHLLLWERLVYRSTWYEVGHALGVKPSAAKRRYQRLIVYLRTALPSNRPG